MTGEEEQRQGLFHHPGESMHTTPDTQIPGSVIPLADELFIWTINRWRSIKFTTKLGVGMGFMGGLGASFELPIGLAKVVTPVVTAAVGGFIGHFMERDSASPSRRQRLQ